LFFDGDMIICVIAGPLVDASHNQQHDTHQGTPDDEAAVEDLKSQYFGASSKPETLNFRRRGVYFGIWMGWHVDTTVAV
jgi:hypothetical protein